MARVDRMRPLYKLILLLGLALGLLAARTAHAAEIVHVVGPGENLFRIGLRHPRSAEHAGAVSPRGPLRR